MHVRQTSPASSTRKSRFRHRAQVPNAQLGRGRRRLAGGFDCFTLAAGGGVSGPRRGVSRSAWFENLGPHAGESISVRCPLRSSDGWSGSPAGRRWTSTRSQARADCGLVRDLPLSLETPVLASLCLVHPGKNCLAAAVLFGSWPLTAT